MSDDIYSRIVHYDEVKDIQIRLSVNVFRDIEYISLRKYYRDFDDEWKPSNEGVSMPIDLNNSRELFTGLVEILSLAESKEVILQHFRELIEDTYQ